MRDNELGTIADHIPPPRRTRTLAYDDGQGGAYQISYVGTMVLNGRDTFRFPRMKERAARRRAGVTRTGRRR